MAHHLFLCSTPFNVVIASMIALDVQKSDTCELWLIDQPLEPSPFMRQVLSWKVSPFMDIKLASHQAKTLSAKRGRKKELKRLARVAEEKGVTDLYTGNDRRVEFQWLMAHLSNKTTGHYIDDGSYSYIGRKTHWLSDKIIDNLLKKLSYGIWWKQPKTIGASAWITIAHLAFPDLAVPALRKKDCRKIPEYINDPVFESLCDSFRDSLAGLNKLDALIILPHESVRSSETEQLLLAEGKEHSTCGIKCHPRSSTSVPEQASEMRVVDANLPFELLLTQLESGCCIIGDVSSALLTARWLRPELPIVCYAQNENSLTRLMQSLDIKVKLI